MGRSYLAISWCFKAPKILEFWNFVRKISHFFKKIKCSKQPKKQNKLNFYFSLSGVPNVRGGWVGSDVWDKVPNKYVFFLTPSLNTTTLWMTFWSTQTPEGPTPRSTSLPSVALELKIATLAPFPSTTTDAKSRFLMTIIFLLMTDECWCWCTQST